MKLKDLISKLDNTEHLFINGKKYDENSSEDILDKEVTKIDIETTKNASKDDLESLGYSFEVGV